jgi:hypothetical protein
MRLKTALYPGGKYTGRLEIAQFTDTQKKRACAVSTSFVCVGAVETAVFSPNSNRRRYNAKSNQ